MVEMVMSMFIFGIAITALVAGMSSSLNLTRQDRLRSVAANLAAQDMDIVRSTVVHRASRWARPSPRRRSTAPRSP